MKKMREQNMDLFRAISAFAVVLIHVASAAFTYAQNSSKVAELTMQIIVMLMQWSVPAFLIITGYFQLNDEKECDYKSVSNQIIKFIVTLFSVGYAYAIMERVFNQKTLNVSIFLNSFLDVLNGNLWDHMWYVYMILGIYLVIPLLKTFFKHAGDKDVFIITGLSFVWTILMPYIEKYAKINFPISINITGYIFYVFAGGLIRRYKSILLQNTKKTILYALILACIGIVAIVVKFIYKPGFDVVGYKSLSVSIIAVCFTLLFVVLKQREKGNKLLSELGRCSWGIYLIHPLFLNLAIKLFHFDLLISGWYIIIPMACVIIFLISFSTIYLLRKVKFIRKFLL